jgi:hypothetical protein
MLNLKDVTGVESSPISKSILENSLGNSILKDSRAYANYEFLLSSIQNGSFKAPSVIFASGDGTFYPKNTAYQGDFYSANILARDGYTNSWMTSYGTDENFNLSYYDGSKLFKSLSIDPATGKGKIRSLEVRNGNLPGQAGFVQFLLGFNESALLTTMESIDIISELATQRHLTVKTQLIFSYGTTSMIQQMQ